METEAFLGENFFFFFEVLTVSFPLYQFSKKEWEKTFQKVSLIVLITNGRSYSQPFAR